MLNKPFPPLLWRHESTSARFPGRRGLSAKYQDQSQSHSFIRLTQVHSTLGSWLSYIRWLQCGCERNTRAVTATKFSFQHLNVFRTVESVLTFMLQLEANHGKTNFARRKS